MDKPAAWIALAVIMAVVGYWWVFAFHRVPADTLGIVVKRFGRRRPDDDPRVSVYRAAGVQARTLRANTVAWLPPRFMYQVWHIPLTWVPSGTIGLVVAKAGAVRTSGRPLARHVECDSFQDGVQFIRGGGEQGRQQQVLTSGYYAINTEMFVVITINTPWLLRQEGLHPSDLYEVQIPIGETGVVITHVGVRPDPHPESVGRRVPDHLNFRLPWQFLNNGGQMGVQQETLDEGGRYAINPWFAHVERIPTRVLILEWTKDRKSRSNLDVSLDQIVLDVQGHTVRLGMKQTVRIPVEAAPRLVRRFGTLGAVGSLAGRAPVQQFVEKDLGATVAGYFRKISATYRIQDFITKYAEVCDLLLAEVRQALGTTGVVAVTTTLEEFECDEPEINELRRAIALQHEKVKLEEARLGELHALRENESVANDVALQKVQVERERKKLEVVELQTLVDLLGPDHVRMERVLSQWVKAGVPQIISGADGNMAQALLQVMPFTQARDMLMTMAEGADKGLPRAATNGQEGPAVNAGPQQGPA